MQLQFYHGAVHTPEQVEQIIASALELVSRMEIDGDLKRVAFEQACQLLGQRSSAAVQQEAIPLDLAALRQAGGKG